MNKVNCDFHVLLIEDDPDFARLIHWHVAEIEGRPICLETIDRLSKLPPRLTAQASPCESDRESERPAINLIITDLGLPDSWGQDTFCRVRDAAPGLPIIVLTNVQDRSMVGRIMREGAEDFLGKDDINPLRIERAVRGAIERHQTREALRRERAYTAQLEAELRSLRGRLTKPSDDQALRSSRQTLVKDSS